MQDHSPEEQTSLSSPSNERVTDGNASADCLQEKEPRIDEEKWTNMKKRVAPVSAAEKEEVDITGITTQPVVTSQ